MKRLEGGIRQCLSFAQAQIRTSPSGGPVPGAELPFFTFSREVASRSHAIGQRLADVLNVNRPERLPEWQVVDGDIVRRALAEHGHPTRLAEFLPEARVNEWQATIEEIVGLHPSLYVLFEQTCATIRRLARSGNVILIGRGANFLTGGMAGGIHVRIVGDYQHRATRLAASDGVDMTTAARLLRKADRARRGYIEEHFGADAADPHHYDIVLNSSRLSDDEAIHQLVSLLGQRQPCRIGDYPVDAALKHASLDWAWQDAT